MIGRAIGVLWQALFISPYERELERQLKVVSDEIETAETRARIVGTVASVIENEIRRAKSAAYKEGFLAGLTQGKGRK